MAEDLVEHKIEVNQLVSIIIKMPKQMSALDFKSITALSNKIFSLSSVATGKEYEETMTEPKHRNTLSREEKDFLLTEDGSAKEISTKFKEKFGHDVVNRYIYYYKAKKKEVVKNEQ